jgi:hypothetical protein
MIWPFNKLRARRRYRVARGRDLDALGAQYDVARRRVWWIFYESDRSYRERIHRFVRLPYYLR